MKDIIFFATVVFGVVNVLIALLVVAGRFIFSIVDRRREKAEQRLKPEVLAWLDEEGGSIPRRRLEKEVFEGLVARYGRALRGLDRDRLAEMAREQGIEKSLAQQLRSRKWWRRAAAAYRVGDIGLPLVRQLVSALEDENRQVRDSAARSLGRLGAVAGVQPLVVSLAHNRIARAVGAQALIDIGLAAADPLERLLWHHDESIRAVAAELLGHIEQGSVNALEMASNDMNPEVRVSVVRALGRCGSRTSVEIVNRMLDDPVPFVRAAAATAVGSLGTKDRFKRLVDMAVRDEYLPAKAAAAAIAVLEPEGIQRAVRAPGAPPHLVEAADLARVS